MKLIEKIKSNYERLKELDNEILEIQKMQKKLSDGNPEISKLELKIKIEKPEKYEDSYEGLERRYAIGGILGFPPELLQTPKIFSSEPSLELEYYNAIVFLKFLEDQKEKHRLSIIEFLSQFEK